MNRPDPPSDNAGDAPSAEELQDLVDQRLVALTETLPPPLREDPLDLVTGLGKLVASLVGGPGGTFGDHFAGKLFPRTLNERMRDCLAATMRRVEGHNHRLRRVERKMSDLGAQHLSLLQEGLDGAARATSSERIAILGAIIGDGLSSDELHAEFERTHIRLLNSLTDRDVETLHGIADPRLRLRARDFGPDFERQTTYARAITAMSDAHLRSLGLINEPTSLEQRPALGRAAPTTRMRQHPTALTPLGHSLILRLQEAAAPVDGAADRPGLAPHRSADEAPAPEQEESTRGRRV